MNIQLFRSPAIFLSKHPLRGARSQGGGRTFGVQGSAVQLAAVGCTWEEPNTQGLHYAQYWPLDAKKARNLLQS